MGAEYSASNPVQQPIDCQRFSRTIAKSLAFWLVCSLRHLFARLWFRQQWIFAYCRSNPPADISQLQSNHFTVVTPEAGRNFADPFLFERCGKTYLFFEEYKDEEPGKICCAEFQPDGSLGPLQRVLSREYHLSYPYVFEWRGEAYMLPETEDNNCVEVYRAVGFPWHWELASVLLNNVKAVDPTLFQYEGKLWLFIAGMESSELSLFFSDSLFGEWIPHPKNPIVCDITRARPAESLFFQQGMLVRPAQDCSLRYGYAISLNKVEVLSETDYREVRFATVLPDWIDGIHATHTMNQHGDIMVLDARRMVPRLTGYLSTPGILHPDRYLQAGRSIITPPLANNIPRR